MPLRSTETRYGAVAVTLHWISALLILALLALGFQAEDAEGVAKAEILALHVPLGLLVVALTLLRIVWWWLADHNPPTVPMPGWQELSAKAIHILFYIVILGMGASGIGMLLLSGAMPIIFGDSQGVLPNFHDFLPRTPHGLGAMALVVLFVLHAGAALYHQFAKRDGLLNRVWFGKRNPNQRIHGTCRQDR